MGAFRSSVRALIKAPSGLISLVGILLLIVLAALGPWLFVDAATEFDVSRARQGMSAAHLLGTDDLGRDILARTIVATRLSLVLAVGAALVGALLGFPLGAIIALLDSTARRLAIRALHIALAFPPVIVALFITAIVGSGALSAMLAIGGAIAPGFARVAQTLSAQVVGSDYVAAGRVVGVSRIRLLLRYVLPNISEPLIIQGTVAVNNAMVAVAALSFLGLGVQQPAFDWGLMLAEGLDKIFTVPVVALSPAAAIVLAGLVFNFLGEALARSLNPLLWGERGERSDGGGAVDRRGDEGGGYQRAPDAGVEGRPSAPVGEAAPVLCVEGLSVDFTKNGQVLRPVAGLDLKVSRGEIIGIVGESGSGKSMTGLAIAQLVPFPGRVNARRLEFEGHDLLGASGRDVRKLLGTRLALIFQDPMSSLNPALKVGPQLIEAARFHRGLKVDALYEIARARLHDVRLSSPTRRLRQYPYELSGGMRQRAMIAMGLMSEPSLLIADEPTTALDVTVQAQIIELLRELNQEFGTAILMISHDISVVAQICTRILVMYAGRIVEDLSIDALLSSPAHPYTKMLVGAVPGFASNPSEPLTAIPGQPPPADRVPQGCPFAPRCPDVQEGVCQHDPPLSEIPGARRVACWPALDRLSGA